MKAKTMNDILPYGTRVILVSPDMYGWRGRDLHPERTDVGFTGVIISNYVENMNLGTHLENVLPYTHIKDEESVFYTVINPLGKKLELMDIEIELAP